MTDTSTNTKEPNKLRKWLLIQVLVAITLLGLAVWYYVDLSRSIIPRGEVAAYEKKRGQSELSATHLTVRWSANQGEKITSLQIPLEYLKGSPGLKDEKGELRWVYVAFSIPGPKPWYEVPTSQIGNSQEAAAEFRKKRRANIVVALDRDGWAGGVPERVRREVLDQTRYWPDGTIDGLERYSRLQCVKDYPNDEGIKEYVRLKELEDKSPSGCRIWRYDSILVSPSQAKEDERGIYIRCSLSSCNAYFAVANSLASIQLLHEDLPTWREKVEPALQLIQSFVVTGQGGATSAARPASSN